jgi:hypothetical protein
MQIARIQDQNTKDKNHFFSLCDLKSQNKKDKIINHNMRKNLQTQKNQNSIHIKLSSNHN